MYRKIFLLVACVAASVLVKGQLGYGPEAGIGMSSMHFAPDPTFTSASTSSIFSWRIGGMIDFGLNKHIYIQSGLFLSHKGQSRNFSFYLSDSVNERVQQTLNINYGELPFNLVYKTGFQGKGRFFAGLGATPAYILWGKNKIQVQGKRNGTPFSSSQNLAIVPGSPLALFDIGLNLLAGYELPTGLFFKTYYTAGVKDIGLGGEVDKNRMWGVSAGYIFGKGRNINKEAESLIDKSTD